MNFGIIGARVRVKEMEKNKGGLNNMSIKVEQLYTDCKLTFPHHIRYFLIARGKLII